MEYILHREERWPKIINFLKFIVNFDKIWRKYSKDFNNLNIFLGYCYDDTCSSDATCDNGAMTGDTPTCTCNTGFEGDGETCSKKNPSKQF